MAQQTNIATENQSEHRDIKRNTSNQIVSYTLPEENGGINQQYGINKVKGVTLLYEKNGFSRTLGELSNELKNQIPNIPTEIVKPRYIKQSNIYVNGVSIGDSETLFNDTFSGRYELTPAASSFRTAKIIDYPEATLDGWKDLGNSTPDTNTHIVPPYTSTAYIRERPEKVRKGGWGNIKFDKAVSGPQLEDGKYRVTQELKDSGRDLFVRCTVGLMNIVDKYGAPTPYTVNYNMRLKQFKAPYGGDSTLAADTELVKPVPLWTWPYATVESKILNADLKVDGLVYPEHFVSTGYAGFAVMGNKSTLEFTAMNPNDSFNWPANETNTNSFPSYNSEAAAVAPTRSAT